MVFWRTIWIFWSFYDNFWKICFTNFTFEILEIDNAHFSTSIETNLFRNPSFKAAIMYSWTTTFTITRLDQKILAIITHIIHIFVITQTNTAIPFNFVERIIIWILRIVLFIFTCKFCEIHSIDFIIIIKIMWRNLIWSIIWCWDS